MSRTSLTATRYRRFDEAIRWGERLEQVHPGNPNATWALARAYWIKGDLTTAYRYGRRMLTVDPSDHEGPASLAALLVDLGLLDAARTEVERAESIAPGLPMSLYARMALTYREGDLDQAGNMAIDALNGLIDARHWGPILMIRIAADHGLRTGDYQAAIGAIQTWDERGADQYTVNDWYAYLTQMAVLPVLRAAGQTGPADMIQRTARDFLDNLDPAVSPGLNRLDLELDANNLEAAVSEYQRMINQDQHVRWWLITDRFIDKIKDDPRVIEARTRQQAELARMREVVSVDLVANPMPGVE